LGFVRGGSITFWYVATAVVVAVGLAFVWFIRRDARLHPPSREERRFHPTDGFNDLGGVFVLGTATIVLFLLLRRPLLVLELQLMGFVLLDWRRARHRKGEWVPRHETSRQYWVKWGQHVAVQYVPIAVLNAVLFWLLPILL
jgi:hypothetical protein